MNENESEIINVRRMCGSEASKHENNSSMYDNDSEEKTSITYDMKDKESLNVHNALLNIYECVKNV